LYEKGISNDHISSDAGKALAEISLETFEAMQDALKA
jgi:hypothetical protein